jgi:hypothetical protein
MMDASTQLSKLVIFGISAAAAVAVAVLAYQPDLGSGSIALSIGSAPVAPMSAPCRQADDT